MRTMSMSTILIDDFKPSADIKKTKLLGVQGEPHKIKEFLEYLK